MTIGIVVESLQTLLSLIQKKQELNKKHFGLFITPSWEALNKVHENYKQTFINYCNMIDEGISIEKIAQIMYEDSIYSEDIRSNLENSINNISGYINKNKEFTYYAKCIKNYLIIPKEACNAMIKELNSDAFNGVDKHILKSIGDQILLINESLVGNEEYDMRKMRNRGRITALTFHKAAMQGDNITTALTKTGIMSIFEGLQDNYDIAGNAYHALKASLLK